MMMLSSHTQAFWSPLEVAQAHYDKLPAQIQRVRDLLGRASLTTAEKAVLSHLDPEKGFEETIVRGQSMLKLRPDRVAMQDATAQMAILQFMQAGRSQVAVPSSVHCDHLIRAQSGAEEDMQRAISENREVYAFLKSAAARYGMGFWEPGSGIIHQVVLEKYAFPGGLMIGTDSHTPNAGGLGMVAIGVGGADAAETMAGLIWEVRAPKLIGVHLKGKLQGWTAPKDVILHLLGILTTKGGTNHIVEYFGEGVDSISCTGKGTITNMGAELGATTSIFPYDERMAKYLAATERQTIAELATKHQAYLLPDADVLAHPENYYDEIIEIDLNTLEPHIVGPHAPDRARPLSVFAEEIKKENWPETFSATLIGSCTNSSYEDIERCANLARQAQKRGLGLNTPLLITPGSNQVYETIEKTGQLETFNQLGVTVLANACGPCIGNWDRSDIPQGETNAIITSFNRNFPKRNDGNGGTLAFIGSPELVMAYALSGKTTFNPHTDTLSDGQVLEAPTAEELPSEGFVISWRGFVAPDASLANTPIDISPTSGRLEILKPFSPCNLSEYHELPILVKTQGQTTTDHISPAGRDWLPLRGHLSGISHNMLLGAVDALSGKPAAPIMMDVCGVQRGTSAWALEAMRLKAEGLGTVVVGDENYGEGSSREHAAMSPRLLGIKVVIARSFARIHETNLKKQGILPLVFSDSKDYERVQKGDRLTFKGLDALSPGKPVVVEVLPIQGGATFTLSLNHSMTQEQLAWFKAGSALNAANSPVA
jgi:aconitate hydratase